MGRRGGGRTKAHPTLPFGPRRRLKFLALAPPQATRSRTVARQVGLQDKEEVHARPTDTGDPVHQRGDGSDLDDSPGEEAAHSPRSRVGVGIRKIDIQHLRKLLNHSPEVPFFAELPACPPVGVLSEFSAKVRVVEQF